jgi:hypothetical protein
LAESRFSGQSGVPQAVGTPKIRHSEAPAGEKTVQTLKKQPKREVFATFPLYNVFAVPYDCNGS